MSDLTDLCIQRSGMVFPSHWEKIKRFTPIAYFGGSEIPPYRRIKLDGDEELECLLVAIRGKCFADISCGFIELKGIYFHEVVREEIHVDFSKGFIFQFHRLRKEGSVPSPWDVLQFLKEPVKRALFMSSQDALVIEKSPETYTLCKGLDKLWAEERFVSIAQEVPDGRKDKNRVLPMLMKAYEEKTYGESAVAWGFWQAFNRHLLEDRLMLKVGQIEFDEPPFLR